MAEDLPLVKNNTYGLGYESFGQFLLRPGLLPDTLGNQVGSELLTFDLLPNVPKYTSFSAQEQHYVLLYIVPQAPRPFLWGKKGWNAVNKNTNNIAIITI